MTFWSFFILGSSSAEHTVTILLLFFLLPVFGAVVLAIVYACVCLRVSSLFFGLWYGPQGLCVQVSGMFLGLWYGR